MEKIGRLEEFPGNRVSVHLYTFTFAFHNLLAYANNLC